MRDNGKEELIQLFISLNINIAHIIFIMINLHVCIPTNSGPFIVMEQ